MAVKQIVEGVYRISLSWSNVYVLTDGNEAVLIDTGLKQDRSALLAGLQQIGIAETQVTAVLLTHAHCDHAGNVAYFTRTSGGKAKLSVHRLEAPYIALPRQPYTPKGFSKLLRPFTSLCLAVGEYLFPVERCSVEVLLEQDTMVEAPGGALRVIAVTTEKRLPYLPDVPTIAEQGFPGYEISSWQGVFAPAGTPKDIIDRLNGEIVAMLNTPEVQARITREGAVPVGSSPEQWSERFKNDVEKWAKVAKSAGLAAGN